MTQSQDKPQTSRATAGPWEVFDPVDPANTYGIDGADGTAVVFYGKNINNGIPSIENARRIVQCVNGWDDLLAALREIEREDSGGYLAAIASRAIAKTGEA
jgi:hypothetical protein